MPTTILPRRALSRAGGLIDTLERQLAASGREGFHVSVVMADVDHFKYIQESPPSERLKPGAKTPAPGACSEARPPAQIRKDRITIPSLSEDIRILSSRPEWIELLVPCTLDVIEQIHSFLVWAYCDLSEEIRDSVRTALHELLLNAIEWGGKLDPAKQVRIAFLRGKRMLLVRISDPGTGFRLKELAHSALNNAPGLPVQHLVAREKSGLRPGGFGLLLARAAADELIFNQAQNEVVFVKYLG